MRAITVLLSASCALVATVALAPGRPVIGEASQQAEPAPATAALAQHIGLLVAIMLVAGLVGGATNYFRREPDDDEVRPLVKALLMGVSAAFLVPLFLNMISSDIPGEQSGVSYLIFLGFCLVASLSSRVFIESVSQRVINTAERAEAQVTSLRSEVDPIILKETELPEADDSDAEEVVGDPQLRAAIRALGNPRYSWRFEGGVAQEADVPRELIREILDTLVRDDYATLSTKRTRDAWALTLRGRQLLRRIESRANDGSP